MVFNRLSLAVGAAVGGLVVFLSMRAVNTVWLLPAARNEGRSATKERKRQADPIWRR